MPLFLLISGILSLSSVGYLYGNTISGMYNVVVYGVTNPDKAIAIIFVIILGIYMILFSLKYIAHNIIHLIFKSKSINESSTNSKPLEEKQIKTSVDLIITFIQLFSAFITCLTTTTAFIKDIFYKNDVIKLNKNIVIERVHTPIEKTFLSLEEKMEWFKNFYNSSEEARGNISKNYWERIFSNIRDDNVENINDLTIAFKKKVMEQPPTDTDVVKIANTTTTFINDHFVEITIVCGLVIVIALIYIYFKNQSKDIIDMQKTLNNDIRETNVVIRDTVDNVNAQTNNINNLTHNLDLLADKLDKQNQFLGSLHESHKLLKDQSDKTVDAVTELIDTQHKIANTSMPNIRDNVNFNIENIWTVLKELENKYNTDIFKLNKSVTEVVERVNQIHHEVTDTIQEVTEIKAKMDIIVNAVQAQAESSDEVVKLIDTFIENS